MRTFLAAGVLAGLALVPSVQAQAVRSGPAGVPERTSSIRTDRQGDPLPEGAVQRLGTVRLRQGGSVHAIALSPDGQRLASAGADGAVRLWETASGKELRRLVKLPRPARAVAFAPDGRRVAVEDANQLVVLVNAATGRNTANWVGHEGGILALAFSPDGKKLATVGHDPFIRIFQTVTGGNWVLKGRQEDVGCLAWSPDGRTLASGGGDGTVRFWDMSRSGERTRVNAHAGGVTALAYSPDGKTVATGGGSAAAPDARIRLWDVTTGKEVASWPGHEQGVLALAFAPDGKTLLSAGGDGLARLWELANHQEVRRFAGHAGAVTALALSADGKTLATGSRDGTLRLWETTTGRDLCPLEGSGAEVSGVTYAPDGKSMIGAGRDGTVRLWDTTTAGEVRRFGGLRTDRAARRERVAGWQFANLPHDGCTSAVSEVQLSADGRLAASVVPDGAVRLWEVATGREIRTLSPGPGQAVVRSVALAPGGQTIAVAGSADPDPASPGWLTIRNTTSGQILHRFDGVKAVRTVAFAPDGTTLAWGGTDQRIHLGTINGETMRPLAPLADVEQLAFCPDSQRLASGGKDGVVRLWEVATGAEVWSLEGQGGPVRALAFTPDGKTLAVGGTEVVTLWEVHTGRKRGQFTGHRGGVRSCAFAPDGRTLATAAADTTVLIWGLAGVAPEPDAEVLWRELGSADGVKAYRARWQLTAIPGPTLTLLRERLKPAPARDPARVRRLIADLDREKFAARARATAELEKLGRDVEPELRKALETTASAEVLKRVQSLLDKLGPTGSEERLRELRAVEVLEAVGTAEARRLLGVLAQGETQAPLTREARAALSRLAR